MAALRSKFRSQCRHFTTRVVKPLGQTTSQPSASSRALDVVRVLLLPGEVRADFLADDLDRVLSTLLTQRQELGGAGVLVSDEAAREGAALDVREDLLHVLLHRRVDDARTGDVVAVLSGVRDRPTLLGNAALVDEVD